MESEFGKQKTEFGSREIENKWVRFLTPVFRFLASEKMAHEEAFILN